MANIRINVGQQVNLYRTYQYVLEEEKIIEHFGTLEILRRFVDGELSEEEKKKLKFDEEDIHSYLYHRLEPDECREDDDDVRREVFAIADEFERAWLPDYGIFFNEHRDRGKSDGG